jgi:hypothetical protein
LGPICPLGGAPVWPPPVELVRRGRTPITEEKIAQKARELERPPDPETDS